MVLPASSVFAFHLFCSALLCFCFSSALLCLLLHLSLCVCLFSACRLLFASLTQFCYFLHFYHFFLSCSRDVEQHVRYSPTLVSGQATSTAKGIFFSDCFSSKTCKIFAPFFPLFFAFFLPSHNIKEPTRIFRPFTFTFSANYFRLFCHSTTVYNHGIGSKCKNYALMFLAAQCSNIEEEFLLKRDESWRKSVKKKGLSRPALCWEISSEFLTRGRGDSWKRVGLGYGLWGVEMGGREECFFTSSLVQDIQQVENWHHQETLDETLYSTSSLPFIKFSTSHLQEVSTFNVINSLNAFNPSNVNCQIYVDGPVDVWQCGRVPQNPSGCIEIDRTAHVGWGGVGGRSGV